MPENKKIIKRKISSTKEMIEYFKDIKEQKFENYSFEEKSISACYLYEIEYLSELKKLIFDFFYDEIGDLEKHLQIYEESFFKFEKPIKFKYPNENLILPKISFGRLGGGFLFFIISFFPSSKLKPNIEKIIEHRKQDLINYNFDLILEDIDNYLNAFSKKSISKCFSIKMNFSLEKNKEYTKILYDLDIFGFNNSIVNFDNEINEIRQIVNYNDKVKYPCIIFLKKDYKVFFEDFRFIYLFLIKLFLIENKKEQQNKFIGLINLNLNYILKISKEFYKEFVLFKKISLDFSDNNYYLTKFLAINKGNEDKSIYYDFNSLKDNSTKKEGFSLKELIERLDIKYIENLFYINEDKLKNYREIKSIESTDNLAKKSYWVSIIALGIAFFSLIVAIIQFFSSGGIKNYEILNIFIK